MDSSAQRIACEPGVVRQGQDRPRAQAGPLDRQQGVDIVQADGGHHRHLAAVPEPQREHPGAVSRQPGAGPGQPSPQRRAVQPMRHILGQREQTGLAVEAQQACFRKDKCCCVVLTARVPVVGAEDKRHLGRIDDRLDRGIEFRAGLALGVAEGGGVDGFRPEHGVGALALHRVVGHREMRVENLAHHRLGAGFASALLVIDQIGLDHPDPQRFTRTALGAGPAQKNHRRRSRRAPARRKSSAC
jgi:hypothetical protein